MKRLLISSENAQYQIIRSLKENRAKRSKLGEVFIEGIESIKQAKSAGLELTRIIMSKGTTVSDWATSLIGAAKRAKVIEMSHGLYKELCDKEEPSEIVVTAQFRKQTLGAIKLSVKPCVLIFDRPSDHGNFGSLVRSADAFDVDAILVVGHAIDPYDPKVIRSSLGTVFHTNIVKVSSTEELKEWISRQKETNKMKIVGSDSSGSISLKQFDLGKPVSLVVGNEAKGMSITLRDLCDVIVRIPISGYANSLNVSCAGSIMLWEIYRK